jgi:metal-sulfur cluster biosynthetic enzyme
MRTITNDTILAGKALEQLKTVYDPELGLNVVDLGLIYQLDFDRLSRTIFVEMTLTTRFCPMGESITAGVQQCLGNVFEAYTIDLHLTFDPPWNAGLISEEGKKQLEQ